MKKIIELRVNEQYADRLFPSEGESFDGVRRVFINFDDPRCKEIGAIQDECSRIGDGFYYGWIIRRTYSDNELNAAEVFRLDLVPRFEPEGESCGTVYDESTSCAECGVGRTRLSNLILDLRRIPRRRDLTSTIASEWIVSERLAAQMCSLRFTGFRLGQVVHKGYHLDKPMDVSAYSQVPSGRKLLDLAARGGWVIGDDTPGYLLWVNSAEIRPIAWSAQEEFAALLGRRRKRRYTDLPSAWFELIVTGKAGRTMEPTHFGIDPFTTDTSDRFKCSKGHVVGLNLISEVYLDRSAWDGSDIALTSDYYGIRQGVLVPEPVLTVSKRFWSFLTKDRVKAFVADVAYLK